MYPGAQAKIRPQQFILSSPALRATPSGQAGARFEQVVAYWAARRLSPAGGKTHIYLRPAKLAEALDLFGRR